MPFTDFLKTAVLLIAAEATALGAVTVLAARAQENFATLYLAAGWCLAAMAIGLWLGRRERLQASVGKLMADARSTRALPELRPGRVLANRLWPLGVIALLAGGLAWLLPQVPAIATGYALLFALAWRKQEAAVTAIELRDGVRFYVDPASPVRGMRLLRLPGWGGDLGQNGKVP